MRFPAGRKLAGISSGPRARNVGFEMGGREQEETEETEKGMEVLDRLH